MIKSLTEQVNELTNSDTLSRVRDSYSSALAQANHQHQQEVLTLQQQIGELREEVDKKVKNRKALNKYCALDTLFHLKASPPSPSWD